MNLIRLATIAVLLTAVTNCSAYGHPPGYGNPQASQPSSDYGRGYDDYGRGYDDYGSGYDSAPSPRSEVGFFYDELSPHGDWVLTRDHGWAWFPRHVRPYWRPYSDGRWVNTHYGWTWVSYEPFGWATYHYGRWAWDSRFGWLWVPGTIWGPAWVSWQHGGGYVGWAPLPPSVGFEIGIGIRLGGFDLTIGIRPDAYSFVPERSFLEPRLSGYLIPPARNVTIIHNTTNITNYTYIDNRVVNRGVDVRRIEQATGRRVQSLRVAATRTKERTEVAASEVRIYRPDRQKLDSVRAGPRANAGLRPETPPADPEKGRPSAERRDAPEFVVAPRIDRTPRTDTRLIEKEERREKQELDRYLAEETRKIEKLHRQEAATALAQVERDRVEKRHQAEREALQQEQRNAAQQLETRQKAKRQAALASAPSPASPKGDKKAAAQQQQKKKERGQPQEKEGEGKGKGQPQQKEEEGGRNEKPQGPPSA